MLLRRTTQACSQRAMGAPVEGVETMALRSRRPKAKLERGESGRWTTVNQEQDAIELGNHFCSCGNKLIEHTRQNCGLYMLRGSRWSWRLTARTNTLARNERKRHGMRQASPSAPAQRNEAKERQRLVTTTVKGKRSVRAQCVTTHLIPSPLPANLHARPRVLDRNAGGCAHCTRRREDEPG